MGLIKSPQVLQEYLKARLNQSYRGNMTNFFGPRWRLSFTYCGASYGALKKALPVFFSALYKVLEWDLRGG